jgi:hypothetical protein
LESTSLIESFEQLDQLFEDLWINFSLERAQEIFDERYNPKAWLPHNLPWNIRKDDDLSETGRLKSRLVYDFVTLSVAVDKKHLLERPRATDEMVHECRKAIKKCWEVRYFMGRRVSHG